MTTTSGNLIVYDANTFEELHNSPFGGDGYAHDIAFIEGDGSKLAAVGGNSADPTIYILDS